MSFGESTNREKGMSKTELVSLDELVDFEGQRYYANSYNNQDDDSEDDEYDICSPNSSVILFDEQNYQDKPKKPPTSHKIGTTHPKSSPTDLPLGPLNPSHLKLTKLRLSI